MAKKSASAGLSEQQLAALNESYPVTEGGNRITLPRFGMLSKDITEESGTGKNKKIKVVEAAGTFYIEKDQGEVNEEGKKVWTKTFLGEEAEIIVAFHRKQLRLFDKGLSKYISSPIYDSADQVLPLYLDKRVIARGTRAELQALYPMLTEKGKKSSKLKEETILYVLYEGEMHQWNLTVSSGWAFSDYSKSVNPSTVVTKLGSVEETNGSNTYRKATFTNKRLINGGDEFELVTESQTTLKETVESDKKYLASQATKAIEGPDAADKEMDEIVAGATKAMK